MNTKNNINSKKINSIDFLCLFLLTLYPLTLILGNLFINVFTLLFSISFFYNFKERKDYLNQKIFYLLIFFFISLLINLIFSTNPENSFPRIIKLKNTYEKPSEKKKRILQENIKRVKKLNKLKNRI